MTDWLLWFTVLSSLVRMVLVDSWKCCVENLKIFFRNALLLFFALSEVGKSHGRWVGVLMGVEIANQSGKGDKRIFQTLTFLFLRTPNFFQEFSCIFHKNIFYRNCCFSYLTVIYIKF